MRKRRNYRHFHANKDTSFMTPRYLGYVQGEEVRKTRKLWLLKPQAKHRVALLDQDRVEMASLYAGIAMAQ